MRNVFANRRPDDVDGVEAVSGRRETSRRFKKNLESRMVVKTKQKSTILNIGLTAHSTVVMMFTVSSTQKYVVPMDRGEPHDGLVKSVEQ